METIPTSQDGTDPPRGSAERGRLWRICRKELRETLRDRRTIGTLILMPILVYPILCLVFQRSLFTSFAPAAELRTVIGVPSEEMGQTLKEALAAGEAILKQRARSHKPSTDQPATTSDRPLSLPLPQLAASSGTEMTVPQVRLVVSPRWHERLEAGEIDLAVTVKTAPQSRPQRKFASFQLASRDSPLGKVAARYVESRLEAVNQQYIRRALVESTGSELLPAEYQHRVLEQTLADRFSLTTLIPLVLILMTVTGAVYPAIDLTAGERERGTLEMVMAAPVPRVRLLLAKYVAVLVVALLTAVANLLAMSVTLAATGLAGYIFGREGVSPLLILQVFLVLILFAAFFSAVLLALTSFARSFKEAQAYLIPLMLLSLAPGVMSLMPNIQLQGILAVTPLMNMVLLARDLFEGQANAVVGSVVIISTALYAAAAIALAARIFGSDAVLYGSQASWMDLFQPPSRPRSAPTLSGAWLCVAALFPLFFLTSSALGLLQSLLTFDAIGDEWAGDGCHLWRGALSDRAMATVATAQLLPAQLAPTPRPAGGHPAGHQPLARGP